MSDTATGIAQTDDDFDDDSKTDAGAEKKFTQDDIDKVVAERLAREKAKYADYADLKRKAAAAMSDQEKALAEAEQRGASAAQARSAARVAVAEFKAAAVGRVSESALAGFLEYADVSKFVGEDGEPDSKAIQSAVKKLAGAGVGGTNFDGGARTSADKPTDMNALIRNQRFGS